MARVQVFAFKVYEPVEGKTVTSTKLSTRSFIDRVGGDLISDGMRVVDESILDGDGRVVLDPASDSAKYLKELDAEGEGEAPSRLNRKAMDALVMAGLVTAEISGPGRITYRMTDRGRQYVRDLL